MRIKITIGIVVVIILALVGLNLTFLKERYDAKLIRQGIQMTGQSIIQQLEQNGEVRVGTQEGVIILIQQNGEKSKNN